jgi:hypothetical protein
MKAAIGQKRIECAFSERRGCGLVMLAVSSYRYPTRRSDEPLRTKRVELAREKPRFGYRRLQMLLRRWGKRVNHTRLHRVYREAGLRPATGEAETLRARGTAAADLDRGEPGAGAGFRARCGGLRASHPSAEHGGGVHPRVFGAGSGPEFCRPKSDASAGCDRGPAGTTESDPLRQRAG